MNSYSLLDNMLEGCQILDRTWRYLYVNQAVARHARRAVDELVGHTMSDLYPGIEQTAMFAELCRCMVDRVGHTFENEFVFPDGTTGWFELRAQPVPEGLFVLSVDITPRVLAQRATARQLRRLRSLREIDLAILGSTDVRVMLRAVLQEALAQPDVDAAAVFLADASATVLEQTVSMGMVDPSMDARVRIGEGVIGRAAAERTRIAATPHGGDLPAAWAVESLSRVCAVPLLAKGRLLGVLVVATRADGQPDEECLEFIDALAGQAAMGVDAGQSFEKLQRAHLELALAYDTTIEGWANALSLRHHETVEHTRRVTELTLRLARRAGMTDAELVHVKRGALLHDIGKMGVPDGTLLKPGELTADEWTEMRKHPTYALELLSPIPYLRPAMDIPYCHHERWDGTGYPRGLSGGAIPLAARLFAVVDVWDALTSDRVYRRAWTESDALNHITAGAGGLFDPRAVDHFISMLADTDGK